MALNSHAELEKECFERLSRLVKDDDKLEKWRDFMDDRFLLHFVRGKKYCPKKAYETLKSYINVRENKYPEFFAGMRPSALKFDDFEVRPLKVLGKNKALVLVSRVDWWLLPDECIRRGMTPDDVTRKFIVVLEHIWNSRPVEVQGLEAILDCTDLTFARTKFLFSVPDIMKALSILLNAFPMRYRGIHIVNTTTSFRLLYNLIKAFTSKKMMKRVYIYDSNLTSLHDEFPKETLPTWLDGTLTDEEAFDCSFKEAITQNDEYYVNLDKKIRKQLP